MLCTTQSPCCLSSQSQLFGGVLAIAGALDAAQKPVLLASHNEDRVVRLWELPTFAERGELSAVGASWSRRVPLPATVTAFHQCHNMKPVEFHACCCQQGNFTTGTATRSPGKRLWLTVMQHHT